MSEMAETITAEELKKKMDEGDGFKVVNVLSEEQFRQVHIPGSISVPGGEGFEERAREQLPDKGQEVVVYCASFHCQASPTAAKKLGGMGYTNVVDFEGGMKAWQEAGYDVENA